MDPNLPPSSCENSQRIDRGSLWSHVSIDARFADLNQSSADYCEENISVRLIEDLKGEEMEPQSPQGGMMLCSSFISDLDDSSRMIRGGNWFDCMPAAKGSTHLSSLQESSADNLSIRLVEESSKEEPPSSLEKGFRVYRVYRGGNWVHRQRDARVTDGGQGLPDRSYSFRGLRLVEED